jgi:uncharacterized protein CbrC (UPF0167 family)
LEEFECYKCKYDFSGDQEQFYDKFADDHNHHEGFEANNIKMLNIRDCTDENGGCERYEIEMTCPRCGTKRHHTDWSK